MPTCCDTVAMTTESNIDDLYESPTIEIAGTLQDLTRNGALANSDDGIHPNTAQPLAS